MQQHSQECNAPMIDILGAVYTHLIRGGNWEIGTVLGATLSLHPYAYQTING